MVSCFQFRIIGIEQQSATCSDVVPLKTKTRPGTLKAVVHNIFTYFICVMKIIEQLQYLIHDAYVQRVLLQMHSKYAKTLPDLPRENNRMKYK